ncbi:Maltose/maltodextrin ABC transporter, substrate binding periplasmic protein MalE [Anopheles sinensis]|uniref:Maltose/maltodextrin ABC transporter, substrate binding periplasmic protein MalE n=1 Tax=Anopheles sinensis TaxID=74873 RepID=A0A084WKM8_ANOSI|nr:Maltose/maltodextrin ABC transporter, substrate binding periplasmic protein MalE [Anopheles sinensis]
MARRVADIPETRRVKEWKRKRRNGFGQLDDVALRSRRLFAAAGCGRKRKDESVKAENNKEQPSGEPFARSALEGYDGGNGLCWERSHPIRTPFAKQHPQDRHDMQLLNSNGKGRGEG